MIFVTVGTHEQQFDRLIEYMDARKADGSIDEEVVIQTGYSTFEPKHCRWQKLFPYPEMVSLVAQARIVITHGGPSSFIMPLQVGKVPIVVPRQKAFDEHVNDHQLDFALEVARRQKNILVAEDVSQLEDLITGYDAIVGKMESGLSSNNAAFIDGFRALIADLF